MSLHVQQRFSAPRVVESVLMKSLSAAELVLISCGNFCAGAKGKFVSSADKAEECSVVEAPTRMMFPFSFASFFTLRDSVLFSLYLVAFS